MNKPLTGGAGAKQHGSNSFPGQNPSLCVTWEATGTVSEGTHNGGSARGGGVAMGGGGRIAGRTRLVRSSVSPGRRAAARQPGRPLTDGQAGRSLLTCPGRP